MKARNRELLALIPASLLVTAGFTGVFIERSDQLSNASLTVGAVFLGLCLVVHVFLRVTPARTPTRTCSRSSRCSRASGS